MTPRRLLTPSTLACLPLLQLPLLLAPLTLAATGCDRAPQQDPAPVASASDALPRSPFTPERPASPLAPAAAPFSVGEWGTTDDYRMRVVGLVQCEVEDYLAPAPGQKKITVEVELEATGRAEVPSNALHAQLHDADGRPHAATLAGCRPQLPTRRLRPGDSARGLVSFDVPEAATALTFSYAPLIVGRGPSALYFGIAGIEARSL